MHVSVLTIRNELPLDPAIYSPHMQVIHRRRVQTTTTCYLAAAIMQTRITKHFENNEEK